MNKDVVLTIGFFDGVHLGHKKILEYLVDYATRNNVECGVVTFDKVSKIKQGLICTLEQKIKKIKFFGIKKVIVCKFDEIKNFSSKKFFDEILLSKISKKVRAIIVGQDFRFGYNRQGSVKTLAHLCKKNGITLIVLNDVCTKIGNRYQKISSTIIRESIVNGNYDLVERLLGEKYFISGKIVKGYGIGKTLKVPTINFLPDKNLVLPRGVIAGECKLGKNVYPAVADIGYSPTIKNTKEITCEVHILQKNFIQNKNIFFRPIKKIRDEKKFPNINLLKKFMYNDIKLAKKYLQEYN
jgi:riboflavin kinase/FMN adenylyltransferase